MRSLLENGTRCLIVQTKFSEFSFWNYVEVCKIAGAKYPAAPLGLMTVAALLPQQWDFKLVDENVEPLLAEHFEWADIVCIGGMLPQQQRMVPLIEEAHQFGCPVVVGGPDPSSQPDLYQSADYLVQGEGEITIPMFIQDLENGCKGGEYKSDEVADMTNAVVPRFDLIRFQDYIQVGIQYSRGCPFNCEFCDIIELFGRKSRTKTTGQVIKELQTLYDLGYRGHVDFVDDNFIGNKKEVKKVLYEIKEWSRAKKYPYYFSTESSMNLADDENLLQMMRDVDFRFVFIGIETPEDEILKFTNKKINTNRSIVESVNKISSYGMIVNGGFIIGFDIETDQTAQKMIQCIQDSGICMAMVGKLFALPKTQLTRRLQKEGRLFEESSILSDENTDLDQLTSGLNFITKRPRLDVLKDYNHVIKSIYHPERYYERVLTTSLDLKPDYKYKPGIVKLMKNLKVFLKVCISTGFNKITGLLYWKTLLKVILKNPRGIETTVNLAAMYIHFYKQSEFIVQLTNKEIRNIESKMKDNYKQHISQKVSDSATSKKSLQVI
jgi:radical SAM superfamily enzyme YgiQ (UPF0313 family)